jgi:peroxiredoxin
MLEKEFSIAVDSILSRAKINAVVYKHVVQYLLDGFKKFGFETVLDYILNNYVIKDDLCLDAATGDMVQRRIEQAKKLPIGGPAPEIVLPDSSGKLVSLTGSRNEKTLVVFYATWCPHCKELLPRLSDLLPPANKYNISVFAVALDTSRNDWVNFIIEKKNPFQNLCDFTGWNGKAVGDYYIYATPSMFLIDKNNKILGKPISYDELVILINK